MNIVHVTQFFHPEKGYQENNLAIIQSDNGNDVTIVCVNTLDKWSVPKDSIPEMDQNFRSKHNVQIKRLEYKYAFSSRVFPNNLAKELAAVNPDVLFIHGVSLPMSLIAMKWGSRNQKILIVDDHMVKAGTKNKFSSLFYFVFKPVFRIFLKRNKIKVDKWVAVSEETKDIMNSNYGIDEPIEVVPLGYNDKHVFYDKPGSEQWMMNSGLNEERKYILYIGKIDFNKNPVFILDAFSEFKKVYKDYELLFVGDLDINYAKILDQKINDSSLEKHITIMDSVPNNKIRHVFSSVEMAIWPFGSSMAMLEAMICKCPVIASEMKVNRERLSDGRGLLFNNNDKNDLIDKMIYATENKCEISEKAFTWVKKFSWKNIEREIMKEFLY